MNKILKEVISSWRSLNETLNELREDQVLEMLNYELESSEPRKTVVERLHQRYTILRAQRERAELMTAIK